MHVLCARYTSGEGRFMKDWEYRIDNLKVDVDQVHNGRLACHLWCSPAIISTVYCMLVPLRVDGIAA